MKRPEIEAILIEARALWDREDESEPYITEFARDNLGKLVRHCENLEAAMREICTVNSTNSYRHSQIVMAAIAEKALGKHETT